MKFDRSKSKRQQGIVTPKRQKPKKFTHSFQKSQQAIAMRNMKFGALIGGIISKAIEK